jgi:hypothetical protein
MVSMMGAGSQVPTYSSRRTRADFRTSRHRRVTVRTSTASASRTAPRFVWCQRRCASCTSRGDERQGLGPPQGRALALGVQRRLTPAVQKVDALLGFPMCAGLAGVQVDAEGAAIELRRAALDGLAEARLQPQGLHLLAEIHHEMEGIRRGRESIHPGLHGPVLVLGGEVPFPPQDDAAGAACDMAILNTGRDPGGAPG